MNKKFTIYQKSYRAFLLALLIFFGATLGRPADDLILAHPALQEGDLSSEGPGDPEPTETPLPDSLDPSTSVPAEATPTSTPEPSPDPLPTKSPTPEPPLPAADPVVRVAPADLVLVPGSTGQSEIRVESVTGLYGVDLRLAFDPETVSITDADPASDGVQVGLGSLFNGKETFLIRNQVNNETGLIQLAVILQQPALPIEGNGTIATLSWQALETGGTSLTPEISLSDTAGGTITHQVVAGKVTVTGETGEPIRGRILLQGRINHQGTQVFLSPENCPASSGLTGPGVLLAETNSDGDFEFLPSAGTTYQCLQAIKPGYLAGRETAPSSNIGTGTLLGGDVTGDGIIDVFDLAFLGSHYGDKDTVADINGDGTVSIFDLTITAANYLREGPVALELGP